MCGPQRKVVTGWPTLDILPTRLLLPVRVLSRLFGRLFLDHLHKASIPANYVSLPPWNSCANPTPSLNWQPACKLASGWCTPNGPSPDRSRSRVAISNNRLLDIENGQVRFQWKDYCDDGKMKTMTLSADEFIRRFLLHVLPNGFQRIRYYGFLGNRHRKEKLAQCRRLLGMSSPSAQTNPHRRRKTTGTATRNSRATRCTNVRNAKKAVCS
jgi:hypothetical protein